MTPDNDRYTLDCRALPGSDCSIAISGKADEVLEVGAQHAIARHQETEGPELRQMLQDALQREGGATAREVTEERSATV